MESKKIRREKQSFRICQKLFDATEDIICLFKRGTFPYKSDVFKTKEQNLEEKSEEESEEESKEKIKHDFKKFVEHIENESKDINYDLFKHYFDFSAPSAQVKQLYETKSKNKNNQEQME